MAKRKAVKPKKKKAPKAKKQRRFSRAAMNMRERRARLVDEWLKRLGHLKGSIDNKLWKRVGPQARLDAVWEIVKRQFHVRQNAPPKKTRKSAGGRQRRRSVKRKRTS